MRGLPTPRVDRHARYASLPCLAQKKLLLKGPTGEAGLRALQGIAATTVPAASS